MGTTFAILLLIALIIGVPAIIYVQKNKSKNFTSVPLDNLKEQQTNYSKTYHKRDFLTQSEKFLLGKLKKIFGDKYIIQPQVPLRMLVSKDDEEFGQYANELNRYIDIGIFNKNYEILALVELNDKSHKFKDRYERDLKVQDICKQANIPLITFWTYGSQTDENIKYIIEKEINNAR